MTHHHHDDVHEAGAEPAAAGMNLITTIIVLLVLAAILWFLFTGPLSGVFGGAGTGTDTDTDTDVIPPGQGQPYQNNPTSMEPDAAEWVAIAPAASTP